MTWSATTASTTRRTARRTATAATTTSAGTAASRARPTDPSVLALRQRQARNHLAILMLSRGVPMILAGDEVLRSQGGNNNAYCQDNALSWFDWALTEAQPRHAALRARADRPSPAPSLPDRQPLLHRRAGHRAASSRHQPGTARALDEQPWHEASGRFLRFTMAGLEPGEEHLHAILNMSDQARDVALPPIPSRELAVGARYVSRRRRRDILPRDRQKPHHAPSYLVLAFQVRHRDWRRIPRSGFGSRGTFAALRSGSR